MKNCKKLIAFCERNAKQIKSKSEIEQSEMMSSADSCVLRPDLLPKYLKNEMSNNEFFEYENAACFFLTPREIDKALKWVRRWCKTTRRSKQSVQEES
jgi:hypothetical protein